MFQSLEDLFGRTKRSLFLNRSDWIQLTVCLFFLLVHLLVMTSGRFSRVEHIFLDYFFRQRPMIQAHPAVVLVEIDEESLRSVGNWPWPWRYHAQAISILKSWKAKSVFYDLTFRESEASYEGDELEKAIEEAGNVFLPVTLEMSQGKTIWVHSLPIVLEPKSGKKIWTHPAPTLEKYAKAVGHVDMEPDGDGVLRRIPAYLVYENETHPYLGMLAGLDFLEESAPPFDKVPFPTDSKNRIMINWPGKWGSSFEHYSFADVVRSYQAIQKGLRPVLQPEFFKDKICLIGLTAKDYADFKVSPFGTEYPSLGIHASMIQSFLSGRFVQPVSLAVNATCLIVIGIIASFLFVVFRNVPSFLAGLGLGFMWVIFAFVLFWFTGVWLYVAHALILILILFIFSAIFNHVIGSKERTHLFHLATRDGLTGLYVIRHFREILNKMVTECCKTGVSLSVILIDLDNFKWINDTYGHPAGDKILKQTAQAIFSCFRATRPVHEADFVARYGGEEFIVMLRNADLDHVAVTVAERIRKAVEGTQIEWEGKRIPVTVSLGVATLHTGEKIPDSMVHRADKALYQAKRTGKNRVCSEKSTSG